MANLPPAAENHNQAIDILELTYLSSDPGDETDPSLKWQRCEDLLKMASGDWSKNVLEGGLWISLSIRTCECQCISRVSFHEAVRAIGVFVFL